MSNKMYIKYIDYFVPDDYVCIDELIEEKLKKSPDINRDKNFCKNFKNETKLDKISIFNEDADFVKTLCLMVEKLLEFTKLDPGKVGYFVIGNEVLLNYKGVSPAHLIHEKYKLTNSTILPLIQPCTASLFAMGLAPQLIRETENKHIIVLTANKWPVTANRWPQITNRFADFTAVGDGMAVLLLSPENDSLKISKWDSLNSGESSINKYYNKNNKTLLFDNRMKMIKIGSEFILDSLKKNNIDLQSDIEKIISSNVRFDIYNDLYSAILGIKPEMFFLENMSAGGHITDIDVIRNLKDYLNQKNINRKKYILLYSADLEPSFDKNYHLITLERQC